MNVDGRYVSFKPKSDGTNEVISAEHINTLQDVSERTQQSIYVAQDRDFLDKALFVLEHHRFLNAMWVDVFEGTSKVDVRKSLGVQFSENEQGIILLDGYTTGEVYSIAHRTSNNVPVKEVLLISNGYQPSGSSISLFFSNNGADWIPIVSGSDSIVKVPFEGTSIFLKAVMTRTEPTGISPRLDSWALLYRDSKLDVIELPDGTSVDLTPPDSGTGSGGSTGGGFTDIINIMHSQLMGVGPDDHHAQEHAHDGLDGSGLISHSNLVDVGEDDHHSKDHQHGADGVSPVNLETDVIGSLAAENLSYMIWTGKPGTTGLHFDPNLGDKLVYVKTPDDETYMFYDMVEDRLDYTITIVQGIAVWEQLHFSNYTTSTGETTVVLAGTEKTHYDANDPMILNAIATIAAPSAPTGIALSSTGLSGELLATWTANPEFDVLGYRVHLSMDGGITWTPANGGALVSTNTYTFMGLVDGANYQVKIQAVDTTAYISDYSAIAIGSPSPLDTVPPAPITNVASYNQSPGTVRIKWDANTDTDFDKYEIWQSSTSASSTWTTVHTITNQLISEVDVTGLMPLQEYFFRVVVYDTSGNKTHSAVTNAIA